MFDYMKLEEGSLSAFFAVEQVGNQGDGDDGDNSYREKIAVEKRGDHRQHEKNRPQPAEGGVIVNPGQKGGECQQEEYHHLK